MIPEESKKLFVDKYSSIGTEKFYKFLLNYAVNRIITSREDSPSQGVKKQEIKGASPELELMDYHDKFMILYRREGEGVYLEMAKLFRKAAHKIYRIMLKKELIEKNVRFLNTVE